MRREQDAPDPAFTDAGGEEDATLQDMPALSPIQTSGPATIEEQISPFHPAARGRTVPGMAPVPSAVRPNQPTTPGMGGLAAPTPRIIGAPELSPADGPTDPDGHSAVFGADGPTDPHGVEVRPGAFDPAHSSGNWDTPTDQDEPAPRARPEVPAPNAPNVLISKSLEMQVSQLDDEALTDPRQAPIVAAAQGRVAQRRPDPGPTEVYLPALKRQKEKEGSDWPLILVLGGLAFVILAVLAAVVVGVLASMS